MSIQSNKLVHFCSRSRVSWMKKASSKTFSVSLILLGMTTLLSLNGCATQSTRNNQLSSADAQTSLYVNQKMEHLATSIDTSLKELQHLDRGDEGPRKNTPLGTAIGGAAGPNLAPVSMPMQAGLDTPLGQKLAQEKTDAQIAHNREMLQKRVKLNWDGSASSFLKALAYKVGFSFSVVGAGPDPYIHIHVKDATIESVLTTVADQITNIADIHVDVADRSISLVYH